jgi:hypothetical protein
MAIRPKNVRVFIRGSDLKLRGQIDDFTTLTMVPRYNRVGTWVLELNAANEKANLLDAKAGSDNPGGGIVVFAEDSQPGDEPLLSGPITSFNWARAGSEDSTGQLTIGGVDDNVYLSRWLTWPVPTQPITNQTAPFRIVSGASTPVETLIRTLVSENGGPTNHASRGDIPHLVLPASAGLGTATAYRGNFRFQPLIEAMAEVADAAVTGLTAPANRGGIGFRLVQIGTTLELRIFETMDRVATAKFSFELGNLTDANYGVTAPNTTLAILGAGRDAAFTDGPQVAKNLVQYARTDAWFPDVYSETFVDVGEIDPAAADLATQLQSAADDHFDSNAGQVGLSITPVDTDSLRFWNDWNVGDFVTVLLPFITLQERVREATITYGSEDILRAEAVVGTVDGVYARRTPATLYQRLTDLKKLLQRKETTV